MNRCCARAYPGLPVVFAEGYVSPEDRVSMHSHASLALTGFDGGCFTETCVCRAACGNPELYVDGVSLRAGRAACALQLMDDLAREHGIEGGLRAESKNDGILSGSSDSGSAALVKALDGVLGLGLDEAGLSNLARRVSETAYRSVFGGLSAYEIEGGRVNEYLLVDEESLSDIVFFAVPFEIPRRMADEIHQAVVGHPGYGSRCIRADARVRELTVLAGEGDLTGLLELMEEDAGEVHALFDAVGANVIKPSMRDLIDRIIGIKSEFPVYWNVAGASVVYAATLSDHRDSVGDFLTEWGYGFTTLHVAGGVA